MLALVSFCPITLSLFILTIYILLKEFELLLGMVSTIFDIIERQLDLLTGNTVLGPNDVSYLGQLFIGLGDYFLNNEFAIEILVGQGFRHMGSRVVVTLGS